MAIATAVSFGAAGVLVVAFLLQGGDGRPSLAPAGTEGLAASSAPSATTGPESDAEFEAVPSPSRSPSPTVDLGPLVVSIRSPSRDGVLGPGTLSIGQDCVTFEPDLSGRTVSLVWPAESVSWRPTNRRLVLQRAGGEVTRLNDGDRLLIEGDALEPEDEQVTASPETARVEGLDESCPGTEAWFVTAVSKAAPSSKTTVQAVARATGWTEASVRSQLRQDQQFRRGKGYPSSRQIVLEAYANPEWYPDTQWGLPLSRAEAADMDRRTNERGEMQPAIELARTLGGYAEMYLDQQAGQVPVFLFTNDIEARRETIAAVMPDHIAFEVRQVEYTKRELREKQREVTADMNKAGWVLDGDIPIAQVGDGVIQNRVLVGLERRGDMEQARRILQDRYGPMVDVEFIGPSQQDPA